MNYSEIIDQALGFLKEKELKEELYENSEILEFKNGDVIVREGQYVKVLPIVLSGSIRVFHANEEREILLYYVEPGQTCMMSLSACFYNNQSPSQAVASMDTTILAIPVAFITEWQRKYKSWNEYVIKTFRNRYDELLYTFEGVAFKHVDSRIMQYLLFRKGKEGNSLVNISHQSLANELGTTRVVVSRILKQFELENKVKLHRGGIEVL